MKYIEGKIFTGCQGIEFVSAILMELGVTGSIVCSPADVEDLLNKKQDYDWDYIDQSVLNLKEEEPAVTFYLEESAEGRRLLSAVQEELMKLRSDQLYGELSAEFDLGRLYCESCVIEDADYLDNWKAYFKPTKITERIVVKPTWEPYEKQGEEIIIEIDPGMAFGTGTHETTSLCLKLMEKYGVKGKKVLDVGCGSGILAAAAGFLGAAAVLGIEIDPIAVEVGRENIALNGLSAKVEIRQGDLTKGLSFIADLTVANLMADLVVMLSADVGKHITKGGIYISSGILIEKREAVALAIRESGFDILEIAEDGEWCAVAAKAR